MAESLKRQTDSGGVMSGSMASGGEGGMNEGRAHEPLEDRIQVGRCVMLYDPSLVGNFDPRWFEPEHWSRTGALRGEAPGRGSTLFFEAEGAGYALRHYRRGGLVAAVLGDRYLNVGESRSRPFREFRVIQRLQRLGLPVAPVVAALHEPRTLWCRGDLITRRLVGVSTLAERLTRAPDSIDWSGVGATIARFHRVGLHHADLNAHNLLVDDAGQWSLIDFDRASFRDPGLWCDANLVRLRRSILKILDSLNARLDEALWATLLQSYREGRSRGGSL
ncbi:MAG: 3-deoxy-D-manno-octulosonic acid kinase [Gammaproteobacteria bacterium]|nr:3-deoxy-D-manno-octulosonic acid kinase [Gammaproteobacteria bacterium]